MSVQSNSTRMLPAFLAAALLAVSAVAVAQDTESADTAASEADMPMMGDDAGMGGMAMGGMGMRGMGMGMSGGMGGGGMGGMGMHGMGKGGMGMHGMGMGGMGGGMMGDRAFMMLDLSDAQRAKLLSIQDDLRRRTWTTRGAILDEQAVLRDLYTADELDAKKIGEAYAAMAVLHRQIVEAQAEAHNRMRAELTAEQKEQLKQMRRGGMMGGGGMCNRMAGGMKGRMGP